MSWGDDMRKLVGLIGAEKVVFHAATGTMLEVSERVWGRGELTNGGKLTYNEDYEVYITKPPFPALGSKKGKPFDKWKDPTKKSRKKANDVKGGWYETYLAAKDAVNRKDLPFELSGEMRQQWLGGVTPNPTEENELSVVIDMDERNFNKVEGLTKTKGEFVVLNDTEVENHHTRVNDLWGDILERWSRA